MPFMRAANISGKIPEKNTAKGVSSPSQQEAMLEAVREMQHMNSLLKSIELILSGM